MKLLKHHRSLYQKIAKVENNQLNCKVGVVVALPIFMDKR